MVMSERYGLMTGDDASTSPPAELTRRAQAVRLLLTDSDGVLTDSGVYYSAAGEEMKRFSIRDGMGVERLRKFAGVDVGIITGEFSGPVQRRAEKLTITELHLGIKDKPAVLKDILARLELTPEQVAYMGWPPARPTRCLSPGPWPITFAPTEAGMAHSARWPNSSLPRAPIRLHQESNYL
jgi:hypothetical protein